MDKIFYPDSVAVIGVSERPDNLAANIINNLLQFSYGGDIHAVGLRSGKVHGIPILTSVELLPDGMDLAVIATPAATFVSLLDACGKKGIRRAIIESGGFSEFSEAGRELEEQISAGGAGGTTGGTPALEAAVEERTPEARMTGVLVQTFDKARRGTRGDPRRMFRTGRPEFRAGSDVRIGWGVRGGV